MLCSSLFVIINKVIWFFLSLLNFDAYSNLTSFGSDGMDRTFNSLSGLCFSNAFHYFMPAGKLIFVELKFL